MFKGTYFKNLPADFVWQDTPVQIYELSKLSNFFQLPTPLLRINYNFLVYIRTGRCVLQMDTEKYDIEAPALVYVSSSSIIAFESILREMHGYFILIEDQTLSALVRKNTALNLFTLSPVLTVSDELNDWISAICKLLFVEINQTHPNPDIAHGLLQALLYKLIDLSNTRKNLNRTQEIAIAFKQLVYSNFKKEKDPEFYAREIGVSKNYLNRCVKTLFHKSTKEVILEITIVHTQLAMWDHSRTIAEISYEVNINDPSYFSRVFKNVTGLSPTAYRKSIMHTLS